MQGLMIHQTTAVVCVTALLLASVGTAARGEDLSLDQPLPEFLSGRAFEKRIGEPMIANWKGVPIRELLRSLSAERQVAIVLDRRIDPTTSISLNINSLPLTEVCQLIAREIQCGTSQLGSTIYIGPQRPAAILKTLAEISRTGVTKIVPGRTRVRLRMRRRRVTYG